MQAARSLPTGSVWMAPPFEAIRRALLCTRQNLGSP